MVKAILKEGLIVSCQALEHEPFHGGDSMAKMAISALQGGAVAIRANGVDDINSIRESIGGNIPIIGLFKQNYDDSNVYITPTLVEIKSLLKLNIDIIAIDATLRGRPNGETLSEHVKYIRENSDIKIMADVATIEEAINAERLGIDFISSTLRGYTEETKNIVIPDLEFIKCLNNEIKNSIVVAEGGINEYKHVEKILDLGVRHIVIGGAITRPHLITKQYVNIINNFKSR